MARPLRLQFPGALYHVTSRGNHGQPVFLNDDHRNAFLNILNTTNRRYNWICHAYCLMDNHYHLLIETPDGNLAKGMRQVNAVYTQYFNRSGNKYGHLFQGRYKAILVEKDAHLLEVLRYVVLNPVRAGIVATAGDFPWSSYRGACGIDLPHPCLSCDWSLELFAKKRAVAKERFTAFIGDKQGSENPWANVKGQVLLGGEAFRENLAPLLKDKESLSEIPAAQRFVSRPELGRLFDGVARHQRNEKIVAAIEEFGYSQKEVADFLGLHYSSISRIIARVLAERKSIPVVNEIAKKKNASAPDTKTRVCSSTKKPSIKPLKKTPRNADAGNNSTKTKDSQKAIEQLSLF